MTKRGVYRKTIILILTAVLALLFLVPGCSRPEKENGGKEPEPEAVSFGKAEIGGVVLPGKDGKVRIRTSRKKNDIKVRFTLSGYAGQKVAFVDRGGEPVEEIEVNAEYGEKDVEVETGLPDRKWMNRKKTFYRIKSFGTDEIEESDITKFRISLLGQDRNFDKPVEGSTVWYGGAEEAPKERAGVILATDKAHVYAVPAYDDGGRPAARKAKGKKGRRIYKWKKADCMINLADVRTDIVYDIYNAYSSRFYPIEGRAMYSDNGLPGLARYKFVTKEEAMSRNRKTGKKTFMAPVQWDFASVVAAAEKRARENGVTLYIADTFRPMGSVDPVAKAVDDAGLLAYGGTSAHNFGLAVDTGWQKVDEDGKPVGEPYARNLQALDRKLALKGPNGNSHEVWWTGVSKLRQEWWHYGDGMLKAGFREHARRAAVLYVNQKDCPSAKRSSL